MVILKILLPLFFITFAFAEVFKVRIYDSVSLGIIDIIIVSVVLMWLFIIKKKKYQLKFPIILFAIICVFSLVFNYLNYSNEQIFISSLYIIRWLLYACLYFVFVDIGKSNKDNIIKLMFSTGFLVIIFGFAQYYLYPSLRNLFYLGWDEHLYRLFSTFLDPNFAGTFLVLFFVFLYVFRDYFSGNKKKLIYLFLVLNFIAIVLTYSRGALLMFLTCVVVYSFLVRNWKFTAGILTLFVIIFFVLSPGFNMEGTNLLRLASVKARINSTKTALLVWQNNPMGVGFNTYRYAREKYGEIDNSQFGPSHAGAGVDNSFVLVLVTTGVVGLLSYTYLLFRIFKLGLVNVKKNKFALVLVVSLGGLIVSALFINSLFYSFIMIWIWILAGITESTSRG